MQFVSTDNGSGAPRRSRRTSLPLSPLAPSRGGSRETCRGPEEKLSGGFERSKISSHRNGFSEVFDTFRPECSWLTTSCVSLAKQRPASSKSRDLSTSLEMTGEGIAISFGMTERYKKAGDESPAFSNNMSVRKRHRPFSAFPPLR